MLKKTLIALAVVGATLLTAATVLPALAQPRSKVTADATTPEAQPAINTARQDRRDAAPEGRDRRSEQGPSSSKLRQTERDERPGDDSRSEEHRKKDKETKKHPSRD